MTGPPTLNSGSGKAEEEVEKESACDRLRANHSRQENRKRGDRSDSEKSQRAEGWARRDRT